MTTTTTTKALSHKVIYNVQRETKKQIKGNERRKQGIKHQWICVEYFTAIIDGCFITTKETQTT